MTNLPLAMILSQGTTALEVNSARPDAPVVPAPARRAPGVPGWPWPTCWSGSRPPSLPRSGRPPGEPSAADRSRSLPRLDPVTRVTLQTVADRVGVSRMTVSNAFSRPDQLSTALREKVLAAAAELGYVGPDPAARALARGTAGAIGVLMTDSLAYAFSDEVATGFLGAVADELAPTGLALTLLTSARGEHVPARDVPMDGALVYSCGFDSSAVDWLTRRGLPHGVRRPGAGAGHPQRQRRRPGRGQGRRPAPRRPRAPPDRHREPRALGQPQPGGGHRGRRAARVAPADARLDRRAGRGRPGAGADPRVGAAGRMGRRRGRAAGGRRRARRPRAARAARTGRPRCCASPT